MHECLPCRRRRWLGPSPPFCCATWGVEGGAKGPPAGGPFAPPAASDVAAASAAAAAVSGAVDVARQSVLLLSPAKRQSFEENPSRVAATAAAAAAVVAEAAATARKRIPSQSYSGFDTAESAAAAFAVAAAAAISRKSLLSLRCKSRVGPTPPFLARNSAAAEVVTETSWVDRNDDQCQIVKEAQAEGASAAREFKDPTEDKSSRTAHDPSIGDFSSSSTAASAASVVAAAAKAARKSLTLLPGSEVAEAAKAARSSILQQNSRTSGQTSAAVAATTSVAGATARQGLVIESLVVLPSGPFAKAATALSSGPSEQKQHEWKAHGHKHCPQSHDNQLWQKTDDSETQEQAVAAAPVQTPEGRTPVAPPATSAAAITSGLPGRGIRSDRAAKREFSGTARTGERTAQADASVAAAVASVSDTIAAATHQEQQQHSSCTVAAKKMSSLEAAAAALQAAAASTAAAAAAEQAEKGDYTTAGADAQDAAENPVCLRRLLKELRLWQHQVISRVPQKAAEPQRRLGKSSTRSSCKRRGSSAPTPNGLSVFSCVDRPLTSPGVECSAADAAPPAAVANAPDDFIKARERMAAEAAPPSLQPRAPAEVLPAKGNMTAQMAAAAPSSEASALLSEQNTKGPPPAGWEQDPQYVRIVGKASAEVLDVTGTMDAAERHLKMGMDQVSASCSTPDIEEQAVLAGFAAWQQKQQRAQRVECTGSIFPWVGRHSRERMSSALFCSSNRSTSNLEGVFRQQKQPPCGSKNNGRRLRPWTCASGRSFASAPLPQQQTQQVLKELEEQEQQCTVQGNYLGAFRFQQQRREQLLKRLLQDGKTAERKEALHKVAQANCWAAALHLNKKYKAVSFGAKYLICHVTTTNNLPIKKIPMQHRTRGSLTPEEVNKREAELQDTLLATLQLTNTIREQLEIVKSKSRGQLSSVSYRRGQFRGPAGPP
ncbi:treacle protein [Cyclospora cayetanensis]|uniref:Treacle protein n=1 Tax=Cyclospora cayetanensis TaxID=88456 RepID=A0A6P6S5H8_9EIME|nr:treacle protein [Cyclospora cayetanensis]